MKKELNNKGFTLIELIISIAILGLVLIVFSGIFALSNNMNRQTLSRTSGSMKAVEELERMNNISEMKGTLSLDFKRGQPILLEGTVLTSEENGIEYKYFRADRSSEKPEYPGSVRED